jgi:protein ImuB
MIMSRIVSVWLPRWPITRFLAAQAKNPSAKPVDPERPFVLALTAAGGPRIAALNEAAEAAGLSPGEPLADARAKAGDLQARAVDQAADDLALRRLALWATRYTPTASPWNAENGADGFFLDIEGAAHLFGGEEKLLADLSSRLEDFGLPARLAVADTPGTAWALSRFHPAPCVVLPAGEEARALTPLPIEALRLSPETCTTLRRLGFKSVGLLLDKPRAPFAARFPAELLRRIDQALGRLDEPLVPIVAPPVYHSLRYLLEPIITQEAVMALANRLMHTLVHVLTRDDVGARGLRLSLYRVDGAVETVDIGLTLPTRNVAHVARLIDLKLEALTAMQEAGFGFEAIGLAVTRAEPIPARQNELNIDHHPEVRAHGDFPSPRAAVGRVAANNVSGGVGGAMLKSPPPLTPPHHSLRSRGEGKWPSHDEDERCAALIDTLRGRLGPQSVQRFAAIASHLPERAEALAPVTSEAPASWPAPEQETEKTRPLLILPRAEPTEVTALIPDGPPRRFRWRGVTYEIAGAQGPERIAAEWWRTPPPGVPATLASRGAPYPPPLAGEGKGGGPTRDYYLVEDADGRRFWLYREGLYERETTAARWFVHGLFA